MVMNARKELEGMVFTSGHAVRWLQGSLEEMSNERRRDWAEGWEECVAQRLFCVGERTRKRLLSVVGPHLPGATVQTADSAAQLAPLMSRVLRHGTKGDYDRVLDDPCWETSERRENRPGPCRRVLHLCGDKTLPVLKDSLAADGIVLDQLVVYHTTTEEVDLWSARERSAPELWLCFFSPSGVDAMATSRAFPGVETLNNGNVVCCAFGVSTAARMRDNGLTVACVAPSPTPEGLALAVEKRLQSSAHNLE